MRIAHVTARCMRAGHRITAPAAVALMMWTSGCTSTTEAGSTATIKVDRELQAYVDADLPTTHAVARDVLENEFRFMITWEALDGREGIIEATSARGRKVRVESYLTIHGTTELEIYVTPFGYQPMQRDILNRIEQRILAGGHATAYGSGGSAGLSDG